MQSGCFGKQFRLCVSHTAWCVFCVHKKRWLIKIIAFSSRGYASRFIKFRLDHSKVFSSYNILCSIWIWLYPLGRIFSFLVLLTFEGKKKALFYEKPIVEPPLHRNMVSPSPPSLHYTSLLPGVEGILSWLNPIILSFLLLILLPGVKNSEQL